MLKRVSPVAAGVRCNRHSLFKLTVGIQVENYRPGTRIPGIVVVMPYLLHGYVNIFADIGVDEVVAVYDSLISVNDIFLDGVFDLVS